MSVHTDCQHYVEQADMCLLYFQLGYFEVSQYKECLTKQISGDNE